MPLRVAVMGCVVNGPGEAREADLGVASGNGKGQIFVKGKVVATVPESKIVETLIDEAMRLAEQALEDGARGSARPADRHGLLRRDPSNRSRGTRPLVPPDCPRIWLHPGLALPPDARRREEPPPR